jgi:predicted kinase
MGLPASGKTTLARGLARQLGLVHLSSDLMRKQLAGLRPTDRRVEASGKGIYGTSLTRRTYAALRYRALQWLRRGHSVVVDATFGLSAERATIQQIAARSGARLRVFVCQADEETIRRRLVARTQDEYTVSDARIDIWPALRAAYSEPIEMHDAVTLDTTEPPSTVVERALAALIPASAATSEQPDGTSSRRDSKSTATRWHVGSALSPAPPDQEGAAADERAPEREPQHHPSNRDRRSFGDP